MAALQDLKSLADLRNIKESAGDRVIVIDFHAEWCGPCKAIAPVYQKLAGQYKQAIFTRCDVDKAQDLAQEFRIEAMPTFVFLKDGSKVGTVKGAAAAPLESELRKHAGPPNPNYGSSGAASSSGSSSAVPSGLGSSMLGQINKPQSTCLNETSAHALVNVFTSGSSSYLESDADEQLLINVEFQQSLKLRGLRLSTASSASKQAPKTLKLFINRRNISFDDAESEKAVQEISLSEAQAEGKDHVALRYVAFQKVQSLQLFVKDNQGGEDATRIDSLDIFGETGEASTADLKGALQQQES